MNLTATPGNFHEVLQCLVEGLKVNRDVARMRTAQVRLGSGGGRAWLMRNAYLIRVEDNLDARAVPRPRSVCPCITMLGNFCLCTASVLHHTSPRPWRP